LLEGLAAEGQPVTVAGEAEDAPEALSWLAEHDCDLVLLDIAMPGPDGLRLAEAIGQRDAPPAVVFVTAHAGHALKAFDLEAVDYLTKPVRRDRLAVTLARVHRRRQPPAAAESADPVLVVNDRGRVLRVPLSALQYLRAEQKYVTLVSAHGRWLLDEPLAELERQLGPGALRVHRNAVVARHAVRALERRSGAAAVAGEGVERGDRGEGGERGEGLESGSAPIGDDGWHVQLANGDWLAVSRRQLSAVREALQASSSAPGAPAS
jgi:two-component system response regulator AlgR